MTDDVADVIPRLRMWQQDLRIDDLANGKCSVGLVGYRQEYLEANILAALHALWNARPPAWKNNHPPGKQWVGEPLLSALDSRTTC